MDSITQNTELCQEMKPTAAAWLEDLIAACFPDLLSLDGVDTLRHGCEFRWEGDDLIIAIDPTLGKDAYEKIKTFVEKAGPGRWPTIPNEFKFEWWDREPLVTVGKHLTDLGNAQRLAERHGVVLRYCWHWKEWLAWDEKRWSPDGTGETLRRAQETAISIYAEVTKAHTKERRKSIADWAHNSEFTTRLTAMLKQAQALLPIEPEELDSDPWLLAVNNGVVNLKTGELEPHDPDLYITKLAPVDYDPAAECPMWQAFLDKIMASDKTMIAFLQRAVGYSLAGDVSERVIFLMHGSGANGKTTFLEVIRALLGDYAQRVPTETLLASKRSAGAATPDIARLKGARFVSASESEEGRRLAESFVKDVTGGDTVTARFLYGKGFDFQPECKIWLATNHKPEIRGTDKAIWDRIRLIPFEVTIPETEQDKHLADKLKAELPGILAWAIEGCLDWQRDGLKLADKVKVATSTYRSEQDVLGEFIEDCCIEGDKKMTLASDLFNIYKEWGGDLNQHKFGRTLRERGYTKKQKTDEPHKGCIQWHGIGIVDHLAKVDLSRPNSDKPLREGEEGKSYEKKAHNGLPGENGLLDPLVEAAENLGGEVVKVETVDGPVEVPF